MLGKWYDQTNGFWFTVLGVDEVEDRVFVQYDETGDYEEVPLKFFRRVVRAGIVTKTEDGE